MNDVIVEEKEIEKVENLIYEVHGYVWLWLSKTLWMLMKLKS